MSDYNKKSEANKSTYWSIQGKAFLNFCKKRGKFLNIESLHYDEKKNDLEKLWLLLFKSYSTINLSWKLLWSWIVIICSFETWNRDNIYNFLYLKKEIVFVSISNYEGFKFIYYFKNWIGLIFLQKIDIREIYTVFRISLITIDLEILDIRTYP